MAYKDPEKQREAELKAHNKMYSTTITFKIRKDDDMFRRRLMAESKKLGITPTEYARLAVREKLGLD